MIEALVNQHGADVKVKDKNGETPIALAQRLEQGGIVEILSNRPENTVINPNLLFIKLLGGSKKTTNPSKRYPKK